MKKYLFLILISGILILTAILAGLSLGPASSYLENKTGFFQGAVDLPAAVFAQSAESQGDLSTEYINDQAILVQLPDARLQERLELVLISSPFSPEDKAYEAVLEQTCPATSIASKVEMPAQAPAGVSLGGEDKLQPDDSYVIYIRHNPVKTPQEYTLVVEQEEPQQLELSVTCTAPAKKS